MRNFLCLYIYAFRRDAAAGRPIRTIDIPRESLARFSLTLRIKRLAIFAYPRIKSARFQPSALGVSMTISLSFLSLSLSLSLSVSLARSLALSAVRSFENGPEWLSCSERTKEERGRERDETTKGERFKVRSALARSRARSAWQ